MSRHHRARPSFPTRRSSDLNAERNGISNVEFREGNAFDLLRDLDRSQERFDAVCLDPPAFAKNRLALAGAKSGYKEDRKSSRLNSSHRCISYAVFCLKKKKK